MEKRPRSLKSKVRATSRLNRNEAQEAQGQTLQSSSFVLSLPLRGPVPGKLNLHLPSLHVGNALFEVCSIYLVRFASSNRLVSDGQGFLFAARRIEVPRLG
jgi:hypothetical protein